MDVEIWNR